MPDDLDLEAVRLRLGAAVAANHGPIAERAKPFRDSAADVPRLLARLTEVEGERDRAASDVEVCKAGWTAEIERLYSLEAERDALAAELKRLREMFAERYDQLVAQEDAIEAANALCSHGPLGLLAAFDLEANAAWAMERDRRWANLRAALAALTAPKGATS